MKSSELEYGCWYRFEHGGCCDRCGTPHHETITGRYSGSIGGRDVFEVLPFSCIGCHGIFVSVTIYSNQELIIAEDAFHA